MSDQKVYFYDSTHHDQETFHVHKRKSRSGKKSPRKSDEPGSSADNDISRKQRNSKSTHNEGIPVNLPNDSQQVQHPSEVLYEQIQPGENNLEQDYNNEAFHGGENKEDLKTKQWVQEMFLYGFYLAICFTIVFSMSSSSAFFMSNAMAKGFMETPFIKVDNTSFPTMPVFPTDATPGETNTEKPSNDKTTTKRPSKVTTTTKKSRPKTTTKKRRPKTTPASLRLGENHPSDEYDYDNDENDYEDEEMSRRAATEEPSGGLSGGPDPTPLILKDSIALEDFWDFAETTLINLLFWDFWYSYKNPVQHTEKDDQLVFYSSQLLGVSRIRQLCVRSDSCTIHPQVSNLYKSCYGYYSSDTEYTSNLMSVNPTTETRDAWIYTPPDELETLSYYGTFAVYGKGGFILDLTIDRASSLTRIQELKNNLWITRATRAIIIDFTVYNPNVNLFVVAKIVVEIPPSGGIYPTSNFYALKFFRYVSTSDLVVLGFEMMFIFFSVYYTLVAVLEVASKKLGYFKRSWNYLEIIILVLSYTCIILGFYRFFVIEPLVVDLMKLKTDHPQFDFPRAFQSSFDQCCAILLFFVFIKMFRFLRISTTIDELSRVLTMSLSRILVFTGMFLVFFLAFGLMACLIFGTKVYEYRTVWISTVTLFQAILGKFNYRAIEEADSVFAPLFLIIFVFFVFFMLANMFLAITIDCYRTVRSQIVPVRRKRIAEYLGRAVANLFPCMVKNQREDDSLTVVEKIRANIMRAGFTETETDIFFAKYDLNAEQDVSEQSAKQLITKLELRKFDFEPIVPEIKTVIELQKEIERLHENIKEIESKLKL